MDVLDRAAAFLANTPGIVAAYADHLERLGFPPDTVEPLARLPGFRNVLIHEYVGFDLDGAVSALDELEPVRRFAADVARRERGTS